MIDTHAHIYLEEFKTDRDDMLARATGCGVTHILMPNIDHTSIDDMLELESRQPNLCYAMMGLHPCYVKKDFQRELYVVEDWLAKRNFLAIGEIGTDLYWDKTFWEQQEEAFKIQLSWAKEYKLPVSIHCRESIDETIRLVEDAQDGTLTGVFHCFTGSLEQAQRIIKSGFYLGIGGVSTFKNGGLDKVLPEIPMDKLVLETDSPYLAPVPHRGKRNEPAYLAGIAEKIATLKKALLIDVVKATSQNAKDLFKLTSHPEFT
jgi:TatD DNase family protein